MPPQRLELGILGQLTRHERVLRRRPLVNVQAVPVRRRGRVAERDRGQAPPAVAAPDARHLGVLVRCVGKDSHVDAVPAVLHVRDAAGERLAREARGPVVARRDPFRDEVGRPRLEEVAAPVR